MYVVAGHEAHHPGGDGSGRRQIFRKEVQTETFLLCRKAVPASLFAAVSRRLDTRDTISADSSRG